MLTQQVLAHVPRKHFIQAYYQVAEQRFPSRFCRRNRLSLQSAEITVGLWRLADLCSGCRRTVVVPQLDRWHFQGKNSCIAKWT